MDFADWLRMQMKTTGETQRQVAALIDVDASAVSRLLAGKRRFKSRERKILEEHFSQAAERANTEDLLAKDTGSRLRSAMVKEGMDSSSLAVETGLAERRIGELEFGSGASMTGAEEELLIAALPTFGLKLQARARNPEVIERRLRTGGMIGGRPIFSEGREDLIPIFSPPVETAEGYWCSFDPAGWRRAPPELVGVADAFGIIVGEGFGPKFSAGEILMIHPTWPVRAGDHCLARLGANLIAAGALVARSGQTITLASPAGDTKSLTAGQGDKLQILKIVSVLLA